MKPEEIFKEITEKIDLSFNQMDSLRLEGLDDLKTFHMIKKKAMKKERERLVKKLGTEHSRVMSLDKKINYTVGMLNDMNVMITEAKIDVKPVDENTWRVHGKVFKIVENIKIGIKGLTVALHDIEGVWRKELGYSCTDENGYFSIDFTINERTARYVSMEEELFLYVSDKDHQILYQDPDFLTIKPGSIDYRAILLLGDDDISGPGIDICTPPETESAGEEEISPKKQEDGSVGLEQIKGIGQKSAEKLREAGIENAEVFMNTDNTELNKILGNVDIGKMKKESASLIKKASEGSRKSNKE